MLYHQDVEHPRVIPTIDGDMIGRIESYILVPTSGQLEKDAVTIDRIALVKGLDEIGQSLQVKITDV